jgi:hypothetical protein
MLSNPHDEIAKGSTADRPELKGGSGAVHRLGPYSRVIDRGAIGAIDGRSREGRFLRAYEKMLIKHVGDKPSVTQRALISRTARLALHLELMDERALAEGRGFGPTDHHFYVAWSNALARHLARLGLEGATAVPLDPMEVIRRHVAARQAGGEAA